jgi:hypothetical protein
MPTVPNWIAKGYALDRTDFRRPRAYKVTHWRATTTQVVVELEGRPGEFRFGLDGLRGTGHLRAIILMAPDEWAVADALADATRRRALTDLRQAIDDNPLNDSDASAEDLLATFGRIRDAATKAMADLADLL